MNSGSLILVLLQRRKKRCVLHLLGHFASLGRGIAQIQMNGSSQIVWTDIRRSDQGKAFLSRFKNPTLTTGKCVSGLAKGGITQIQVSVSSMMVCLGLLGATGRRFLRDSLVKEY